MSLFLDDKDVHSRVWHSVSWMLQERAEEAAQAIGRSTERPHKLVLDGRGNLVFEPHVKNATLAFLTNGTFASSLPRFAAVNTVCLINRSPNSRAPVNREQGSTRGLHQASASSARCGSLNASALLLCATLPCVRFLADSHPFSRLLRQSAPKPSLESGHLATKCRVRMPRVPLGQRRR